MEYVALGVIYDDNKNVVADILSIGTEEDCATFVEQMQDETKVKYINILLIEKGILEKKCSLLN